MFQKRITDNACLEVLRQCNFMVVGRLGGGTYGSVYLCKEPSTNIERVVKVVDMRYDANRREINILQVLPKHENIVEVNRSLSLT